MARNGDLRLTGAVNYGYQRAAAESAAAGLVGVRHINNKIKVTYDTNPPDITRQVQDALARQALIPDSDVAAVTSGPRSGSPAASGPGPDTTPRWGPPGWPTA